MECDVVSLFGGPGGLDLGVRRLGLSSIAVELDVDAHATATAAGHKSLRKDVRQLTPKDIKARALTAGPPCPSFSLAGKGDGRQDIDRLIALIPQVASKHPIPPADSFSDPRTPLVLEPMRWIATQFLDSRPYDFVLLEQVSTVLPIWEAYARQLRLFGYEVLTDIAKMEQYGVPQSRRRAVLLARWPRSEPLRWPTPTHSAFWPHTPSRLDPGLPRWVSMAEALHRGMTHRPAPTVTGGGSNTGGAEPFGNGSRQRLHTERAAGRWLDPFEMLSTYSTNGDTSNKGVRPGSQPASTITGKTNRNKIIFKDGQTTMLTPAEAAILQTFPPDYPWQGSKNAKHQQIGNAVPPLFAEHALRALCQ